MSALRPSGKIGGLSRVASAAAIYNNIFVNHPEFLAPLCRGFHHDVRGEGPTGKFDEVTDIAIPVFSHFAGKLSCCLNSKAIATAQEKIGGTLSSLEREALAYIEERAMAPDIRFEFMLEPGDILMINNYTVFARPYRLRRLGDTRTPTIASQIMAQSLFRPSFRGEFHGKVQYGTTRWCGHPQSH